MLLSKISTSVKSDRSNYDFCLNVLVPALVKVVRGLLWYLLQIRRPALLLKDRGVRIVGPVGNLQLGTFVKLERNCLIQTDSTDKIIIGNRVTIGAETMIRPSSFYGGPRGCGLTVGAGSAIGVRSYIGCSGKIEIGENVLIGPSCTMIAENHNISQPNDIKEQGVTRGTISVHDGVWLGANVTVLSNVTIGENAVIGAGSVVTKSIPARAIAVGNPCRVIRERS